MAKSKKAKAKAKAKKQSKIIKNQKRAERRISKGIDNDLAYGKKVSLITKDGKMNTKAVNEVLKSIKDTAWREDARDYINDHYYHQTSLNLKGLMSHLTYSMTNNKLSMFLHNAGFTESEFCAKYGITPADLNNPDNWVERVVDGKKKQYFVVNGKAMEFEFDYSGNLLEEADIDFDEGTDYVQEYLW